MFSKSLSLSKRCTIFRSEPKEICPDCSKRFTLPKETPVLSESSLWEYPFSFRKTRIFSANKIAIYEGCLSTENIIAIILAKININL